VKKLKFRGWYKKRKKMIPLSVINVDETNIFDFMQYIGRKDINKKEIYEADIISYHYYPNETYHGNDYCNGVMLVHNINSIIIPEKGETCIFTGCNFEWIFDIEVIGNKYEDCEMFKKLKARKLLAEIAERK